MTLISPKCYKARAFNGSEAMIPASQVYGQDYDVQKSEAYWISEWILDRKEIQFSTKKEAWFDDNGNMLPNITYTKHIPEKIEATKQPVHDELTR